VARRPGCVEEESAQRKNQIFTNLKGNYLKTAAASSSLPQS
jgi:hypothetical protein